MIIRKNATKESVQREISEVKQQIRWRKAWLLELERDHKKRVKREQRDLDMYVERLAEMQILIKTK
jgi:hypothetical protein